VLEFLELAARKFFDETRRFARHRTSRFEFIEAIEFALIKSSYWLCRARAPAESRKHTSRLDFRISRFGASHGSVAKNRG
jgi:hypothetical protein